MRLDALLSRYGYCSRREAPGWIKRHSITFKGKPCSSPTDKVQAEGILQQFFCDVRNIDIQVISAL